jgi:hypothetical protein
MAAGCRSGEGVYDRADFIIYGKEDTVSRMVADLKRRNIDLAVEMGMLYGDLK